MKTKLFLPFVALTILALASLACRIPAMPVAPVAQDIAATNIVLQATLDTMRLDATQASTTAICDGCYWLINTDNVMIWNGATDGSMDIHQGTNAAIQAIRAGYTAKFHTDVPGWVIITIGNLDGKSYTTETKVWVAAGNHVVSDSIGLSGGFRWTPADGYGWRK